TLLMIHERRWPSRGQAPSSSRGDRTSDTRYNHPPGTFCRSRETRLKLTLVCWASDRSDLRVEIDMARFGNLLAPVIAILSVLGPSAAARAQSCQGGWVPKFVTARAGHAMAYDRGRGVTVLFGGSDGPNDGETWEWDGSRWRLKATSGPLPRNGHAMAYDSV